ncbi:MAG: thioredoxin [Acidobacteria bacterium]|nr:thioredoxin [Acidobacteriota bacterium]
MQVVPCSNCGTKNRVDLTSAARQIARCGKCGTALDVSKAEETVAETKPLTVTDSSFQRDVLEGNARPVLLDCWAPWCGPCRIVGPIMDQLAAESNGRYRVAKLNVDENPRTAAQFQIQSIPTMLIFKNGKLIDRLVGAQPKQAIAARLMAHTN